MKNQYFGDINDYRKYGLLRILSNHGQLRTAVCWMLTANDGRADGKFTDYLQNPGELQKRDSELFESLYQCLKDGGNRDVRWAEAAGILPGAIFYPRLLTDAAAERAEYFRQFWSLAQGCELVFFDPDNGLEIKSKKYGRKNSCKYLYWPELQQTYDAGHSVVVYQHFPRVKRDVYIADMASQIRDRLGLTKIITFRTPRVLFLLIPQPGKLAYFQQQSKVVEEKWDSEITVWEAGH